MKFSKIRWTGFTWNFFTGCDEISTGCLHCYARVIAENPRFASAFPNGFKPTFKPHKLRDPYKVKEPHFCFVNSMSDFMHKDFTDEMRDQAMEVMLQCDRHIYQILTKRAQALPRYVNGWLKRKGLAAVPKHIWFGVSIETNTYTFRANFLREVPGVRFISAEPLLAPLSTLSLEGIHWLIVGGESGNGSNNYRRMSSTWAVELLMKARSTFFVDSLLGKMTSPAYYFKQSSGMRTETGIELIGERFEEYPFYPNALSREEYLAIQADLAERAAERKVARAARISQATIQQVLTER